MQFKYEKINTNSLQYYSTQKPNKPEFLYKTFKSIEQIINLNLNGSVRNHFFSSKDKT